MRSLLYILDKEFGEEIFNYIKQYDLIKMP